MTPSLDLARSLAAAAMNEIERSGTINSANLSEAILARMLVTDHMPQPQPQAPAEVVERAKALLTALNQWVIANGGHAAGLPYNITSAGIELERALHREGLL